MYLCTVTTINVAMVRGLYGTPDYCTPLKIEFRLNNAYKLISYLTGKTCKSP
jgi:hypothetical protein